MSTTLTQFRAAVEVPFTAFWTFTTVASENIPFATIEQAGAEYVRFSLRWLDGNFAAVGRAQIRREVLGTIQVFTPQGVGTIRQDELVENALDFWERVLLGVRVRNPRATDIGEDGKWFQTNVAADLQYDQFRPGN